MSVYMNVLSATLRSDWSSPVFLCVPAGVSLALLVSSPLARRVLSSRSSPIHLSSDVPPSLSVKDASEDHPPPSRGDVSRQTILHGAHLAGAIAMLGLSSLSFRSSLHVRSYLAEVPFYLYATLLAGATLSRGPSITLRFLTRLSLHLSVLLFLAFLRVSYRNVWPLAWIDGLAQDREDAFLAAKLAILFVAGLLVPVLLPRRPQRDATQSAALHPEETASILSFILFTYLTPLIKRAWRSSLSSDDLPPLPPYEQAATISRRAMPLVDPFLAAERDGTPRRMTDLLLGILRMNWREICGLAGVLVARLLMEFLKPIALKGLLSYIEQPDEATIRPATWIALLVVGPFLADIFFSFYVWIQLRVLVRSEGLLSQLILNHSLRVRFVGSSKPGESGNSLGRIINLLSSDLESFLAGSSLAIIIFYCPLQSVLSIYLLHGIISWSSFAGLAVMLGCFPLPGLVLKRLARVQKELSAATDARVQIVTELLQSIRTVKLFAWEETMEERLRLARKKELNLIRTRKLLQIISKNINTIIPLATMIASFSSYTLLERQALTAAKVFSSMAVFSQLSWTIGFFFTEIAVVIRSRVSLGRLSEFLNESELLSALVAPTPVAVDEAFIGFKDAAFSWDRESLNAQISLNVEFLPGKLNLVSGPTASGKSSLLLALLGEMHLKQTSPSSAFNLPRAGGVAFVPQQPWLIQGTIRENILLDAVCDEARLNEVVDACGLAQDLASFADGASTQIGERGLTLSGGQQARVALARAVYSPAAILLIDDVLSALDAHTSRWIVDHCLASKLLRDRTVIIASHHTALLGPISSFGVRLAPDGAVESQGPMTPVPSEELQKALDKGISESRPDKDGASVNSSQPKILIPSEDRAAGRVPWSTYRVYIDAVGWPYFLFFVAALICSEAITTATTWWLGYWSSQYADAEDPSDVKAPFYLLVYSGLIGAMVLCYSAAYTVFTVRSVRAGESLHRSLVSSILASTSRWLDITPTGRLLARFSKDINAIDGSFAAAATSLIERAILILVKASAIVLVVPLFSVSAMGIAILGLVLGEVYMNCQMQVKRMMANAQSPLLSHVNASIRGAVSIRAYGLQDWVRLSTQEKVDAWARAANTFWSLNRWIAIAMALATHLFTALLAVYLVYVKDESAELTGWTLSVATLFSSNILWLVRIANGFSVEANSLERVLDYTSPRIPQEAAATVAGTPPAAWPTSGDLRVEGLGASYDVNGVAVLSDISFNVRSGEKIGIVGRTGSSKSSLALALMRSIPTSGSIFLNGVDSSSVNLRSWRSAITIIPQEPVLLSGSLRFNLDPFDSEDDACLNDALKAAGLPSLSLDIVVAAGGTNFSTGERQILALARALVRRSALVIMDEATSSVDHAADKAIQRGIRLEMRDVTVITIAHRLRSIMDYDRVMVLKEGRIVALDTPLALLANPDSLFSTLVRSSGEEAHLREMAQKAHGGV